MKKILVLAMMGVFLGGCGSDSLKKEDSGQVQTNQESPENMNREYRGQRFGGDFLLQSEFIKEHANGLEPKFRGIISKSTENEMTIKNMGERRMGQGEKPALDEKARQEMRKNRENMTPEEQKAQREKMMQQEVTIEKIIINEKTIFAAQNSDTKEFAQMKTEEIPDEQFGMVWLEEGTQNAFMVVFLPLRNN